VPLLSRCAVRASLLYLVAGTAFGALLLTQKALGWWPPVGRLRGFHAELLLFGWLAQLAMGVAYWILPRFREGPPRGNVRAAVLGVAFLNAGIMAVAAGSLIGGRPSVAVAGRSLEVLGVAAFAVHAWPRVRSVASSGSAPAP
jgi:cbb3-type cytochrome oxidase subunit 1